MQLFRITAPVILGLNKNLFGILSFLTEGMSHEVGVALGTFVASCVDWYEGRVRLRGAGLIRSHCIR